MQTEYKGKTITFNEKDDKFTFEDSHGDIEYSNPSLAKVKQYIDRLKKKEFKKFEIIIEAYYGDEGFSIATVTSVNEEGNFWVKTKSGYREKVYRNHAYLKTEKNLKLIEKIQVIRKGVKKQEKIIEKYEGQMTPMPERKEVRL